MRIDSYIADATLMNSLGPELSRLRNTTHDVEAIFLKELLGAMHKAGSGDEQDTSTSSDIYRDMSDQAFAQSVSKSDALGIGKLLYDRLSPTIFAQARARQSLQVGAPKTENKG